MMMDLTLIAHMYNEEYYLPNWLLYHKSIFTHGIIIDYHSTDNSRAIVKQICPTWELRTSRNTCFDAHECDNEVMDIEQTIQAGYKIALNVTEWIVFKDATAYKTYQRDTDEALNKCIAIKPWTVTTKNTTNNDQIKLIDYIQSFQNVNTTYRNGHRFLHNYPSLHYSVGRHAVREEATEADGVYILWVGFFPWIDVVHSRRLQIKYKMSPRDIVNGLGTQHLYTLEKMNEDRLECVNGEIDAFEDYPEFRKVVKFLIDNIENNLYKK
jgi:ligand-binding SRPBCC domain-containing protein